MGTRGIRSRSIIRALLVILIVAGVLYYFYSYQHRDVSTDIKAVQDYAGDAATTSAVRTALGLNKELSGSDIHVETTNRNVTLTGRVPTAEDKRVAEEIAQGTKGVASVVNNLQVAPSTQSGNGGEGQPGN
jgi:osmotically-inducible protein OsmY